MLRLALEDNTSDGVFISAGGQVPRYKITGIKKSFALEM